MKPQRNLSPHFELVESIHDSILSYIFLVDSLKKPNSCKVYSGPLSFVAVNRFAGNAIDHDSLLWYKNWFLQWHKMIISGIRECEGKRARLVKADVSHNDMISLYLCRDTGN